MSLYTDWLKTENEIEKLKFFFKNSFYYKTWKTRASKAKDGIYLTDGYKKYFAEYSKVFSEFIRLFPVENNKFGNCCREIKLDVFVSNMKKQDDLLNNCYKI